METQQLRHFWAVAEHGNLVRAAEALHVTQPALSRSIKALEASLDVKLFDRTPRGVALTPFGTQFLQHVRIILNEKQRAVLNLNALRNGRKGHLYIGVGHSFASDLLPQAITALYKLNPSVSIRVREGYYEELVGLLRAGDLDLVLSLMPPAGERVDDLVVKPLIQMRTEVIAAGKHPLASKRTVSMGDLAKAKWLLQDQTHAAQSFLELFERNDVAPPAVIVKTTSMSFLRGMLQKSDFLALIADQLVARDLADGTLRVLNAKLPKHIRHAGAIYRAHGTASPVLDTVLRALEAACAAQK